jgi:translation initiation factor IF-2
LSKIRVYELAKMLGKTNKELMTILVELGVDVKTHMSSIDTDVAQIIEDSLGTRIPSPLLESVRDSGEEKPIVRLPGKATVRDLCELMGMTPEEGVKTLLDSGILVSADAKLDQSIVDVFKKAHDVEIVVSEESADGEGDEEPVCVPIKRTVYRGEHLVPRPPIVTVMGHVDHGKTTLLDCIRNTNITAQEAGGITQHIGASTVVHEGRDIVFLDTPGHEAFTAMRARGARATDIAILVVAADDGVMPQTREAINHAKAAGVPIIVAVNKIDKPDAKPDRVKQQLSDLGLMPEEWGGQTVTVEVSAKSGQGVPHLLEMILLVAEMEELKADPTVTAEGVVIEAELDKGKGPVATVIVQQGTLCRGDVVIFDTCWGKIRAMIDSKGKAICNAGPSTPVEILGLTGVPQPGEIFRQVESEREARDILSQKEQIRRDGAVSSARKITLEELYSQLSSDEKPHLNLLVKCDVQGSAEALCDALEKIGNEEVGITILHKGVGRIAESDVMLASASKAIIIGFNVRPDANAKKIADDEGVQIRLYDIIYDVIDDVKAALEGLLTPIKREHILGQAEIREIFKVPKAGKIAGCYVTEGIVRRNASVRLIRGGVVIWNGTLANLRRFKDEAREVAAGYECGINLGSFQDIQEKDIIEVFEVVEEKRHLDS